MTSPCAKRYSCPTSLRAAPIGTFAGGSGQAFEIGVTIRLSQALGELVIASDLTIDGDLDDDGAPDVIVTGDTMGDDALTTDPLGNSVTDAFNNDNTDDNVRVVNVTGGSSMIYGLVITGGSAEGRDGAGGGVQVADGAALALQNVSVSGNHAQGYGGDETANGGAINNAGIAMLTNTTVSGNVAGYQGGGIYNKGFVTVADTTVSSNQAIQFGGGILMMEPRR